MNPKNFILKLNKILNLKYDFKRFINISLSSQTSLVINKNLNKKLIREKCLYLINKRNYLIETTAKKVLNVYNDSEDYIKSLINEQKNLVEFLNNETENLSNKNSQFQRLSYLNNILNIYKKITSNINELNELKEMSENENDEMKKMIREDINRLNDEIFHFKKEMITLLLPEELEDKEDAIIELSAGVGGQESRIFCSELFEMYKLYSQSRNWTFSPVKIDTDITELGEMMRQAVIEVNGLDVFKYFKYESGIHRVQRVPKTEAKGRIHTSTVGVLVTPKPVEIQIELNPKDLKIETKTSGGPGGQHANKTESAVRIVHLPTGIMVYNDEERQMHQNKSRALANLKQKLYQKAYEEQLNKRQANRKMQIGSSSRSERIRTYNYVQDRITDHRLDENFIGIQRFLSGESLVDMIDSLKTEQQVELLYLMLDDFKNNKK